MPAKSVIFFDDNRKPTTVKNYLGSLLIVTVSLILLFCSPVMAQQEASVTDKTQTTSSAPTTPSAQQSADAGWHLDVSPYLWFAGAHGVVGALGHDVGFHASPGDLLSHFDIGLMGAAEARYDRLVLNGDLMWIRLSDSRALPFPGLSAVSADVRVGELVWTSKIGYRAVDRRKIKVDANAGVRFWHLGQKLSFNPSNRGLNFTGSQTWADIVIGGRVLLPVREKVAVELLGDVGGLNAMAKQDYQFAALLEYKICPKWTLGAGYRYLFIDYRPDSFTTFNMTTSGALLGVSYRFK